MRIPTQNDVLRIPSHNDVLGIPTQNDVLGIPTHNDVLRIPYPLLRYDLLEHEICRNGRETEVETVSNK